MIIEKMKATISALRFGVKYNLGLEKVNIFTSTGVDSTKVIFTANGHKMFIASFSTKEEAEAFLADGRKCVRAIKRAVNKVHGVQPVIVTSAINKGATGSLVWSVMKDGEIITTGTSSDKAGARAAIREVVKGLRQEHKSIGYSAEFIVERTQDGANGFRKSQGKTKGREKANAKSSAKAKSGAMSEEEIKQAMEEEARRAAGEKKPGKISLKARITWTGYAYRYALFNGEKLIDSYENTMYQMVSVYARRSSKEKRAEFAEEWAEVELIFIDEGKARHEASGSTDQKPGERKTDYFKRIIGAGCECDRTKIKRHYRKWMQSNHPDKVGKGAVNHDLVATITSIYQDFYK